MKAAFIETQGSPDVIQIGELPIPTIHEDQILVKVLVVTVNHVDCYIRSGKYQQPMPLPFIIGRDFCGEVVNVGKNIKQFKVGDRVWSNCQGIQSLQGTFAQFLAVNPATIFPLPDNVDPVAAIGTFHSAFTAILGLTREAELKADDVLFVHGGAGNIGAAVIQVGKSMGARVIASTHGTEKTEYCYELGADKVLDYKKNITEEIAKLAPKGVDVFWNTSRHHDFKMYLALLAKKGRYILMAGSGSEALLPIGDLYTKDASIRGFAITNASLTETQEAAMQINQLLERHAIKSKIAHRLPLSEAREAHRLMEKEQVWGKIILEIP